MGVLTLNVGGRRFDGTANGNQWIGKDGLDGWWDSPDAEFEELSIGDQDGAFDPSLLTLGPKRVNVRLEIQSSSADWAETVDRPWATALAGLDDIGFSVSQSGRTLSLRQPKVRGKVRVVPNRSDMRLTSIGFTAWSAFSYKYGPQRQQSLDATMQPTGGLRFPMIDGAMSFGDPALVDFPGVFRIFNPGTAPLFPTFTVRGPLDSFTITSEAGVIEYAGVVGRGQTLVLSPYLGGRAVLDGSDVSTNLLRADWVPVRPLEERGYLFTPDSPGAGSGLIIDYPDGAWK